MPTAASDGPTPGAGVIGARLREARAARELGVRELARRIGVTASMVSQMERGAVMPSVATLRAIASELEISLDDLFRPDGPAGTSSVEDDSEMAEPAHGDGPVQRADTRRALALDTGVTWQRLTPGEDADVDFLYTTYPPGSASAEADRPARHGGREYGIVQRGRLGVTLGRQTYGLSVGDSISFESTVPHRLFAIGDEPAEAIWFVTGRRTLH